MPIIMAKLNYLKIYTLESLCSKYHCYLKINKYFYLRDSIQYIDNPQKKNPVLYSQRIFW